MTASSLEEEQEIALSQGGDDFLRKPFRASEIFTLLETHLGAQFVYEKGEAQGER
jgi:CheY-like chemotaxis protein